jgi:hypothetical protein
MTDALREWCSAADVVAAELANALSPTEVQHQV